MIGVKFLNMTGPPSSREAPESGTVTATGTGTSTAISTTNKPGTTLLTDIHSLLHYEDITDISLIPNNALSTSDKDASIAAVPAIKAILAARSPVFRRMLYGEFRETTSNNQENVVQVQLDYSGGVLKLLVEFCFTDRLLSLDEPSRSDAAGTLDGPFSRESEARLLTNLSGAAHYFDIPKLENDIKMRLMNMMGDSPSLACAILDEASKILPGEELSQLATEKIRARPMASLLSGRPASPSNEPLLSCDSSTFYGNNDGDDEGGIKALDASLLEQVIFDESSSASELTKFLCLQKWVKGCQHPVPIEMLQQQRKQLDDDILTMDQSRAPSPMLQPSSCLKSSSHDETPITDLHHQQKLAIAKHLAQKLDLSLIPASDLSSIVTDSMLLSTHSLFQAYRLQALTAERTKSKVIVEGAGLAEINGTYIQGGVHEGTPMYNKEGVWKDREEVFRIFLCTYSNGNKSWFISIVPKGKEPGKTTDLDFYECPVTYGSKGVSGVAPFGVGASSENTMGVVPSRGWKLANFGQPPVPKSSLIVGYLGFA